MRLWRACAALSLAVAGPLSAQPLPYQVDRDRSVLAVITHKEGFASAFAHNHLVEPTRYEATLRLDPGDPVSTTFSLSFAVSDLRVDDPERQESVIPRLSVLGILDEFGDISESDRDKVRESMLSDDQLDAEEYPEIEVALVEVTRSPGTTAGGDDFPWSATIRMRVHGRETEVRAPARMQSSGEEVRIEAFAETTFTAFGIEPYSSFLGAVKNQDRIHLYLDLHATPADPPR